MAAPVVSAEVRGLEELDRGTREMLRRIVAVAPEDLGRAAGDIAGQVRAKVPHRSGAMAASVVGERRGAGAVVGYSGAAVYAGWIDYGGGRYAGRPYVPTGRYLLPTATAPPAADRAERAGRDTANRAIRETHWT